MWTVLLILLAAWLLLSIIGLVVKGLLWLFVIGVILFVGTSLWSWTKRQT